MSTTKLNPVVDMLVIDQDTLDTKPFLIYRETTSGDVRDIVKAEIALACESLLKAMAKAKELRIDLFELPEDLVMDDNSELNVRMTLWNLW